MDPQAEEVGRGLGFDDAVERQRARLDGNGDHCENHGQLIGDQLGGGAQSTDERVFVA